MRSDPEILISYASRRDFIHDQLLMITHAANIHRYFTSIAIDRHHHSHLPQLIHMHFCHPFFLSSLVVSDCAETGSCGRGRTRRGGAASL